MKKLSLLLLGLFVFVACNDAGEQEFASQELATENPETRIAVLPVPESHKTYIRTVFRRALPSSVTDAQVDAVVEGYLVEYVHHKGVGYITENFHIHSLMQGIFWPGPNEEYMLQMRTYFVNNLNSFSMNKNYKYLGMALHPIYDAYDANISESCSEYTRGSTVFGNYGEWFHGSPFYTDRTPGYGLSDRAGAISYIYRQLKWPMGTRGCEELFNVWASGYLETNWLLYEPCIDPAYF